MNWIGLDWICPNPIGSLLNNATNCVAFLFRVSCEESLYRALHNHIDKEVDHLKARMTVIWYETSITA